MHCIYCPYRLCSYMDLFIYSKSQNYPGCIHYHDTVLFCINQSGDPKPEVKWYRGEERIKPKKGDKRVRYGYDSHNDLYVLQIQSAQTDDSARYTVRLSNQHGSAHCTVTLNVTDGVTERVKEEVKVEESKQEVKTEELKQEVKVKEVREERKEEVKEEVKITDESSLTLKAEERLGKDEQGAELTLSGKTDSKTDSEVIVGTIIPLSATVPVKTKEGDEVGRAPGEPQAGGSTMNEEKDKVEDKQIRDEEKVRVVEERKQEEKLSEKVEVKEVQGVKVEEKKRVEERESVEEKASRDKEEFDARSSRTVTLEDSSGSSSFKRTSEDVTSMAEETEENLRGRGGGGGAWGGRGGGDSGGGGAGGTGVCRQARVTERG